MTKKLEIELYKLTDSFLTEAKDQNGNERSLKQLNRDRHLFVINCLRLFNEFAEQAVKEVLGEIKQKLPKKFDVPMLSALRNHEEDKKFGFNMCISKIKNILDKYDGVATFPNPSYSQAEVDRQKEQAVREVIEDLENLPNFWCELPGFIEYYSCVRDIINKLKAKYPVSKI